MTGRGQETTLGLVSAIRILTCYIRHAAGRLSGRALSFGGLSCHDEFCLNTLSIADVSDRRCEKVALPLNGAKANLYRELRPIKPLAE
jgi:hypothetical protein